MADYMLLFRGGNARQQNWSDEQLQVHFQKWQTWIESLGAKGIYKGGEPLSDEEGCVVLSDGTVTDSPLVEAKELIGGLVILDVDSLEAATEEAKNCPVLEAGGKVEVRSAPGGPCGSRAFEESDAATEAAVS